MAQTEYFAEVKHFQSVKTGRMSPAALKLHRQIMRETFGPVLAEVLIAA